MSRKQSTSPNPFLFLVGCPRSGTTLLQRMLDSHPQLAVANDSHFIPRAVAPYWTGSDVPLAPELLDRVLRYHRFERLGLSGAVAREAADRSSTYAEFVSALYDEHARSKGKRFAGEKTPDYVRYLPILHALFPAARVIHIVRDGRDVALSTLEWTNERKGPAKLALWSEQPVAVCALWWRWQVSTGRRDGASVGSDLYAEIGYEDLVEDPEKTLRRLSAFLGLPYAREMASFHKGRSRRNPHLSAKSAWLPATPGLRDWRTQMPEPDAAIFEALAGDLLSELGYERRFAEPDAETTRTARTCRAWWDEEMRRRDRRRRRRLAGAPA